MLEIIICLLTYLLCAISPSIILSKKVLNKDIRTLGSKNAGTTNAIRTMGKKWGAIVFALDILKVILSYGIFIILSKIWQEPINKMSSTLFILAAVIGHVFPLYYNFKGGKGVAVFLTSTMLVDIKAALVCLVVSVLIIAITKYVSLGSVCGTTLLCLISLFMDTNYNFLILLIAACIIVYKHSSNIKRLINGTENKLFKK